MLIYIKKETGQTGYDIWHVISVMTYDIRHVVVIESTMYRKDIKVYIKQETVYDIYNSSLNSIRIDELYWKRTN